MYTENPYGGGGFGWVNDRGGYTGYGYDNKLYPTWGYREDYKPW